MAEKKMKRRTKNNLVLVIVSVLLSVILWLFLSLTVFTDVNVSLYDVDIDFNLEGSYANLAGLSVISADADSVNLSFTGRRDSYKDYTNSDVRIRLNLDNVKASGSYDIPLIVESTNGDTISDVVMVPESVHVVFDRIATKVLSVENGGLIANLSNINAANGYIIDPEGIAITPSSITISGPQDYINQVTSCVLSFDKALNLKTSTNITADHVTLYNENAIFEQADVSMNTNNFNVRIPVYTTKELPLTVNILDNNGATDVGSIKYTLSTESILVRSESDLENIDELMLGYIDVRDIYPGYVAQFNIPPSSYYTNISGVDTVTVSFELEGYTTKSITIKNTQIFAINGSLDYDVTIEQDRIRATVVGPEEILNSLDSSNFIAQINLIDYQMSTGPRMMTAYVYAPGYPSVWSRGITQVYGSFEKVVQTDALNTDGEEQG